MNLNVRFSQLPISSLILNRVSSRSFGLDSITQSQLLTILEAGRFAPSAQNNQPWHFAYALKNDENYQQFYDFLNEGNKKWCAEASALAVILSTDRVIYNDQHKVQPTHMLDAGLAIQNILLQASEMQLVAHPMAGFDAQKVIECFNLPSNWHPVCIIAFGTKGNSEETITTRKPLEEISTKGIPTLPKY